MATRYSSQLVRKHQDVFTAEPPRLRAVGRRDRWLEATKRLVDIAIAVPTIALLSPLLLGIAITVALTSPGGVVFRQTRVGRGGRHFVVLKFRTMYQHVDDAIHRQYVTKMLTGAAPSDGGETGVYKLCNDPRVTRVGTWLRRTSLDELPQLFNVLRGEMSLVGPRPILPWEAELCSPEHRERFEVKPGITGLWQVTHRNRVTMLQAFDLDVEYVRRRSARLDLLILLKTLPVVLSLRGV